MLPIILRSGLIKHFKWKALLFAAMLSCALILVSSFAAFTGGLKNDNIHWVSTKSGHIHIKTFKNDSISGSPNLVFVLHGDAPKSKPFSQYILAEEIASHNKNTIGIGILRPGYTDPDSNTSDGIRGLSVGDNYTEDRIKAIAEVIQQLKDIYKPCKTILVGHSGGATIAADISALYPELVNSVVLISCPCYLTDWRAYMQKRDSSSPQWSAGTSSISPDQVANKINDSTQVVIISGTQDSIAPMKYSSDYYKLLQSEHKNARLIKIPNQGHQILLHGIVASAIESLLKNKLLSQ
ncbi:MAG TPA: alpha/beta hydrolase [Bacteroidia bacterium]|nr:alpha/beta hydrolase [Bacteroidia bacterium]